MKRALLTCMVVLLLTGCNDSKQINMAEFGFDKTGTLYVNKVDYISSIYEDEDWSFQPTLFGKKKFYETKLCLDFAFDGQRKVFCTDKYLKIQRLGIFDEVMGEEDDRTQLNTENIENLKRMEEKLHQVAGDNSVLERFESLLLDIKKRN